MKLTGENKTMTNCKWEEKYYFKNINLYNVV